MHKLALAAALSLTEDTWSLALDLEYATLVLHIEYGFLALKTMSTVAKVKHATSHRSKHGYPFHHDVFGFFEVGQMIASLECSISRALPKMKPILREQRGIPVSSTSLLSSGLKAWSFCWIDLIERRSVFAGIRAHMQSTS